MIIAIMSFINKLIDNTSGGAYNLFELRGGLEFLIRLLSMADVYV